MAVQPQTPYKEYTANGSTKSFALEFDCDNQDHLIVLVDDVEAIVGTWSLSNGAVVFGNAPATGKKITVQRNTPFRRDGDFQSYDNSFRPGPVNKGFDWIWLKLQELGVADWILGNRIDALKAYVDDRDDELRAYLLEEIRKQGVALDQLDDYYNYLMQRLAQIAVDKGWDASFVVDASGETQQQVNYNGGSKWHSRVGGYQENERVVLVNGDIVKSTIDGNTNNPNSDMSGWIHEDYGLVKSFISLEEIEQDPYDGQIIFIKTRDNESNGFFSGHFRFVSGSTETVDNGIIFNATGGRWIRVLSGTINPLMFGNKSTSDQIIINKAIVACKRFKQKLDLSVSGWDIDGEIKFYEYPRIYIISSQDSIINCSVTGTYTNGYCVEFGGLVSRTRMVGAVIDGNLWIRTDRQEVSDLHGIYMEGSWLNVDYVRAEGFNGTGINADSIWDSNIRHLSCEVCGNINNYAMKISSRGDTTNCTTFSNLQIEQAQQKILQINAVRTTILNIHQERATIANNTNVNIDILLSNSTIEQAVFDSLSNVIDIKLNLDGSTASNIYAAHARVKSDYGTHGIFNTLIAIGYEQVAPASKVTLNSPVIIDYISVEGGCNVNGGTIKDVKNSYNCRDLNFYGTAIESVNLNQNILGNITFDECPIKNVYETKSPATNYKKTTFNDCNIDNFVGAYNGQARVNGGFIKTVNLTSQALVDFVDVEGVTFSASGNIGYLTRNCSFSGSVSWSLPTMPKPAGSVTERIGYDAAGKIYQNATSGVNWVKIA